MRLSWRRAALFQSAIALISLGLAAGATELALTLFPVAPERGFSAYRANLSYLLDERTDWVLEPRVYAPNVQVNQYGFRGPPIHPDKPASVYRVIVTGGSAAFDWASPDNHSWPHYVESILRCRTGRDVEVLNTGTPGFSTYQASRLLRSRLMAWKPDMVLHYELYNDSLYFRLGDRAQIIEGWKRNARANYVGWFAHSHPGFDAFLSILPRAGDWFRMRLIQLAIERNRTATWEIFVNHRLNGAVSSVGFGFYEESLRAMASLLHESGNIPFGIVSQASLLKQDAVPEELEHYQYSYRGLDHARLWEAYQRAWALDERIANEYPNGFFIPAHTLVPSTMSHFIDEVHTSHRGSVALAVVVANALTPRLVDNPQQCTFSPRRGTAIRRDVPAGVEPVP